MATRKLVGRFLGWLVPYLALLNYFKLNKRRVTTHATSRFGALAMFESTASGRTFLGGKIVWNGGQSTVNCTIRNLSKDAAFLEVASVIHIPDHFELLVTGDTVPKGCSISWRAQNRIGFRFGPFQQSTTETDAPAEGALELLRSQLLALRVSLDEVDFGIVLLDAELRAQFINRAFRKIWRLSDAKADSKPAFVALLYHGRESQAYEVPLSELDAYVAERVAAVRIGDIKPRDLRLSDGTVMRLQCAVLPNGGRMLSYVPVTDIVKHRDDLEVLRSGLDEVKDGIILLNADLNVQFVNRAVRRLWNLTDEQLATRPPYSELVGASRQTGAYGMAPDALEAFIATRIALVKAGDPTPRDILTSDGRHVRAQCAVLPNGGRMLTYCDITDLVHSAKQLNQFATLDAMTGLFNRRHFLNLADAEWSRFQRYHRPLSMLMIDADHFKSINDRFGHAVGDAALVAIANACTTDQRSSDIVGRIGGEEFALLLPETDLAQAGCVAERICSKVASHLQSSESGTFNLTVSIGLATATQGMSGVSALMKAADHALYQAKYGGRNRIAIFKPETPEQPRVAAE